MGLFSLSLPYGARCDIQQELAAGGGQRGDLVQGSKGWNSGRTGSCMAVSRATVPESRFLLLELLTTGWSLPVPFLEPFYSCPAPLRGPRKYLLCISILFHTGGRRCPEDSAGCGLAELLKIILKMPTVGGSSAGLHFTPSTPGLATS